MNRLTTILLALLCATGLALLAGCGGDAETVTVVETAPAETAPAETTPSEVPAAPADADEEPDSDPVVLEFFRTPTGNIGCAISDEGARCDIGQRDWTAPRPAGCPAESDYGQGLAVDDEDGPGTVVCAGDSVLDPSAQPLDYGNSISAGDFTCTSEQVGVTCRDDGDNRGFFISTQSYRLF